MFLMKIDGTNYSEAKHKETATKRYMCKDVLITPELVLITPAASINLRISSGLLIYQPVSGERVRSV